MTLQAVFKNGRGCLVLAAVLQGMAYLLPISRVDFVGWGIGYDGHPVINYLVGEPDAIVKLTKEIYQYREKYGPGAPGLSGAVGVWVAHVLTLVSSIFAFTGWALFQAPGRKRTLKRLAVLIVAAGMVWALWIGFRPMPRGVLRVLKPGFWLYAMSLGFFLRGFWLLSRPAPAGSEPQEEEAASLETETGAS